jgi:hypothetical protein
MSHVLPVQYDVFAVLAPRLAVRFFADAARVVQIHAALAVGAGAHGDEGAAGQLTELGGSVEEGL